MSRECSVAAMRLSSAPAHIALVQQTSPHLEETVERDLERIRGKVAAMAEPASIQGNAAEVHAGCEAAHQFLQSHVHDLAGAILGENINQPKRGQTANEQA